MRILATFLLLLASLCVSAESIPEASTTKVISDAIMQHFMKDEFDKGIEIAKKYWPTSPAELDALAQQITEQWTVVRDNYGEPIDYEFVRVQRLGSSFVRLYFLHKFEHGAIVWKFTYYKPEKGWFVTNISFQGDLEMLYETVD